jgi:dTDP-4-amino-4,6-dideoxygalactose transaminase
MILCSNPGAQYFAHREEIDAAISRVLTGGRYILGPEVEAFEREFASFCGVGFAIGVGSGTEALHVALVAAGIGPGHEVVTVAHTAVATAAAIRMAGATPVFVDIDAATYTIDPALIERALSERTRAIVPVHLYGQPAELDPILEIAGRRGLMVIEDCAQAHGARYRGKRVGSLGDLGCFSFYPTKNLGAIGDGGMIVTSSAEHARRIRLLREYGWAERYVSTTEGWNSRLDELQAAVLRAKLRHLDADNLRRRELARRYDDELRLEGLRLPVTREDREHVYHLYVVASPRRDEMQAHLQERGIGALIHYPVAVHRQPAYARDSEGARLPETERAASTVLSLPMYPELTPDEQSIVIEAVRSFR